MRIGIKKSSLFIIKHFLVLANETEMNSTPDLGEKTTAPFAVLLIFPLFDVNFYVLYIISTCCCGPTPEELATPLRLFVLQ
ncbi:MAG: hypothetical protein C0611_03255 [Desulfobacteraceae bacterium]|nr:MAG: hypothetical protein C0611_03255 [Desulfobacteraceae bacterium]